MSEQQSQWRNLGDTEFRSMFLKAASGQPGDADAFFGSFKYVADLLQGSSSMALDQGILLLEKCRQIDANAYRDIHKGTPFYWLGTAAFLVHDYQTATFFFDAAVSEDIRIGADPINKSTPALRFIQIEGDQPQQAARALVMATQVRIEEAIANYNNRSGRPASLVDLELSQIRDSFLRTTVSKGNENWRSLSTALISYFLEWNYRMTLIELRTGDGTVEPFFIHLFKGCVLFESLLKANPKDTPPLTAPTLGPVLQYLSSPLGIPRNIAIGNTDFPAVLADLSSADDSITTAVKFTGRVRNTVGHNLGWKVALDKSQYDLLARMIASSCLHAIACLYR
jgi:hypothetical protein